MKIACMISYGCSINSNLQKKNRIGYRSSSAPVAELGKFHPGRHNDIDYRETDILIYNSSCGKVETGGA